MNPDIIDWNKDVPPEPEEEYLALIRSLQWTEGFGLFFIRCSPAEGEQLITKVKEDISEKNIEVLRLQQPVDNFYQLIEELENRDKINILFITGLEYSFYEYEDTKRLIGWNSKDIYSYSWKGVPPVLVNLNQQRERFRDNFNICFVFLVPLFVIKYLIQRAPDFFDWRSGVFEFATVAETVEQESSRILQEGDYEKYILLTPTERNQTILEIRELLAEENQTPSYKFHLLVKLGKLLFAAKEYEEAIASYDQALTIKPDDWETWNSRGIILCDFLRRYEEAIAVFDQALKIKSDYHQVWYNRGVALANLGRFEEAIAAFEQALKIKPDYHRARSSRAYALSKLGRNDQAITSYDQVLKIKPDDDLAWEHRGIALLKLGRDDEARASLNKAKKIKADNDHIRSKLDSLWSNLDSHQECNFIITTVAEELAQNWRWRIFQDSPEQSDAARESIIRWLLGSDSERLEMLSPKELEIAKQAMEYRYGILCQRYLGKSKELAYRNLITRLGSLVTLRNKIQTWVSLSRDRQRSVVDVLQEIIQELLQSDNYMQQQTIWIAQCTKDARLQNALLFASTEECCLRPVRNQPLIAYRFVNFLRRTQRGGLTQVPLSDTVRLIPEEILTDDSENRDDLVDHQAITEYIEVIEQQERQELHHAVKQEFENYLLSYLGQEALQWLRLYLQGKSQDEIARKLNKPIKEVYRLREKISYHAVRVFAVKGKPELVENWLSISVRENNLGLTPKQLDLLMEKLTITQRQVLSMLKADYTVEAIASHLKLKTHQVIGEWTKIYLLAQALRTGE